MTFFKSFPVFRYEWMHSTNWSSVNEELKTLPWNNIQNKLFLQVTKLIFFFGCSQYIVTFSSLVLMTRLKKTRMRIWLIWAALSPEYLGPWNVGPELFAGLLRAPSEAAVKLFLTHNRHSGTIHKKDPVFNTTIRQWIFISCVKNPSGPQRSLGTGCKWKELWAPTHEIYIKRLKNWR